MNNILRLVSAAFIYLGLSLSANAADVAAARAALEGSMRGLFIHPEPQPVAFVRFTDFDGNPMSLADYQGKLIVVNFWATWCGPCRKEMPMLSELQTTFEDAPFEVVTIATGRNNPAGITRFFDSINVDNLPKHLDPKGQLAVSMGVEGLPTTLILSPEGQELARMKGDADWASESAKAVIRALLPQS